MSMLIRWSLERLTEVIPDLWFEFQNFCPPEVNAQELRDIILQEYGCMGIAFPVTKFKAAMNSWCLRNAYMMKGIMNTTLQEYNIIENYDRTEETTRTLKNTGSLTSNTGTTGSNKSSGTDTESNINYEGNLKVSGSMHRTDEGEGSSSSNTSGSSTNDTTDTYKAHMHGNIGVTSAQDMIKQEREIVIYDAHRKIADQFAKDLLVGIYFF